MTNFDEIRDLISSDLERLQKIIKQSLSSNSPLLNKIVDKYLETKGKQIRPIIVVLSAKFFGAEVSDGVLDGKWGEWCFSEAENRLHAQKALLEFLVEPAYHHA